MTDNHTLTDADRQRIEQEAQHFAKGWGENCDLKSFKAGAEYATIFERQQQEDWKKRFNHAHQVTIDDSRLIAELVIKNKNQEDKIKILKECNDELFDKKLTFEAEYTELRNKVIDEVITKLQTSVEFGHLERHWETLLIELNSLKTK